MQRPIPIRFWCFFALILAIASGIVWCVLEGIESAFLAAGATLVAALPLSYAAACLLADRAARRALQKAKASASDPNALALLKDVDTVLLPRRLFLIGEPHIKELVPEGLSQSDLLALAASAEQDETHPYAKIICAVASDRRLRLHRLSAVTSTPHAGVEALLTGQALRVGRLDWLEAEGVKISAELATRADQLAIHGLALVGVALGARMRGFIAFEEDAAEMAKRTIAALGRANIQTILLTHGSRRFANAVGKALGTTEAKSLEKTENLTRELQLAKAKGHVIASLVPALDAAADITLQMADDTPRSQKQDAPAKTTDADREPTSNKKDETAVSTKTASLVLTTLAPLPALIAAVRKVSRAQQSCFRLALVGFVVLALPAFGLLHAIGLPFLPPAGAAIGQLCLLILTVIFFLYRS